MINKSPIARKLMIMIVVFSATITIMTTGSQLLFDYKKELSSLNHQIDSIKTTQIDSLSHSIWAFDSQGVQIIINNTLNIQDIEYLFVHVNEKHSWSGGKLISRKTIDTTIPIHFKDGQDQLIIGSLRIVASLDNVYDRLLRKALLIFIGNGVKTFFVSLFILFLFQRLVTRHLIDLEEYATKVAKGATSSPFRLNRKKSANANPDELDKVGSAINLMRENLQIEIQKIKQAEKILKENQEDLKESQRIARVGSWRLDLSSNKVICSEELYKIYGFDPALSPPPFTEHQKLFTSESWEQLSTALTKTVDTGTPYELELETVREDGSSGWVWVHGEIVLDEKGQKIGLKGVAQDVTKRKQAEEDHKKLLMQLQQAQKMESIGTLAGGIAHDFNNILGAILGYAEMIQVDSPAESRVKSNIERVIEASHRAKELVKQILAFSRQTETDEQALQPALIIYEAVKMLRASLPTTIEIEQNIDKNVGNIFADPIQIHQVITNLCTNAFHSMEETGGALTISLKNKELASSNLVSEAHVQPGLFVEILVADTGPGISPQIIDKIFDPFFTTKEVGKGTGMGLAIIHGIAKKSGGFVSCQSPHGEGATFCVYFPVHVVTDPPEIEYDLQNKIPLGNEHILFIDDEEILVNMYKIMLERLGYRVTIETSSIEALKIIQNLPDDFDLVITDQTMPGMTGDELARRILQIRPGMPIILCTGFSNMISEEKAMGEGIKGFAMKPLAQKNLSFLIRKVLDGQKRSK